MVYLVLLAYRGVIMGPEKKQNNKKTTDLKKQNVPLRIQQSSGAGGGSGGASGNPSPNGNIWNLQSMKQR
jgi:hypothetical protein